MNMGVSAPLGNTSAILPGDSPELAFLQQLILERLTAPFMFVPLLPQRHRLWVDGHILIGYSITKHEKLKKINVLVLEKTALEVLMKMRRWQFSHENDAARSKADLAGSPVSIMALP
jgi:hypothetical protein